MRTHSVLVIESDPRLAEVICAHLRSEGIDGIAAGRDESLAALIEGSVDVRLLILDADADGSSGAESLRTVRQLRGRTPLSVILTSSNRDVEARVVALKQGADDFLVKPFDARELAARAAAVLRRSTVFEVGSWSCPGLVVNAARRRVLVDGRSVELTATEFDLLALFAGVGDHALTRDVILERLRGAQWGEFDRSIDILVSRLRSKLGDDPRKPRFIRTVRGVGYQFVATRT